MGPPAWRCTSTARWSARAPTPPRARRTSATGGSAAMTSAAGRARRTRVNFIGFVDEIAVYPTALLARRRCWPSTRPATARAATSRRRLVHLHHLGADRVVQRVRLQRRRLHHGYAWNFGDGTTGTGVSPSKTYGSAGTRTVTLTVTDNNGARGSTTRQVTVSPVTPGVVAADAFNRTIANGWGSPTRGRLETDHGQQQLRRRRGRAAPADGGRIRHFGLPATGVSMNVDLITTLGYDKTPTGEDLHLAVVRPDRHVGLPGQGPRDGDPDRPGAGPDHERRRDRRSPRRTWPGAARRPEASRSRLQPGVGHHHAAGQVLGGRNFRTGLAGR